MMFAQGLRVQRRRRRDAFYPIPNQVHLFSITLRVYGKSEHNEQQLTKPLNNSDNLIKEFPRGDSGTHKLTQKVNDDLARRKIGQFNKYKFL